MSSNYPCSHADLPNGTCIQRLSSEKAGETGDLMLSVKADSRAQGLRPPPRSKYYFHIASEFAVHTDDTGVVLSDLAAAHRYAVSAI